MKIGIHGLPANAQHAALFDGVCALGSVPIWRAASAYRAGEVESLFDAVVAFRSHPLADLIVSDYQGREIPALVVDCDVWSLEQLAAGAPLHALSESFPGRWPLPSEPLGPPELAAAASSSVADEPTPAVSAPAVRPAALPPRGRGRRRVA